VRACTLTNMLPATIRDVAELEELLSRPPVELIETLRRIPGDILALGVGGKMGPTLARMARRAADAAGSSRRVIGVARFSDSSLRSQLESWKVQTIACDLLDERQLQDLPDAPNVIYMAGMKFGATGNEPLTWAMNSFLPGMVAARYRSSRIVAFSTGNIYGLSPSSRGGSREEDRPQPVGEYAMSCLGRERMLEHFSRVNGTPMAIMRLNYACEMRYGVLVDLALRVWEGRSIDLRMGHFNVVWQGDANAVALRLLEACSSPPVVLNVTGPQTLSVRTIAQELGRLLEKKVQFDGEESPDALLSNASRCHELYGPMGIDVQQMLRWIADWTRRGGPTLNKPTHFESRDGKF